MTRHQSRCLHAAPERGRYLRGRDFGVSRDRGCSLREAKAYLLSPFVWSNLPLQISPGYLLMNHADAMERQMSFSSLLTV